MLPQDNFFRTNLDIRGKERGKESLLSSTLQFPTDNGKRNRLGMKLTILARLITEKEVESCARFETARAWVNGGTKLSTRFTFPSFPDGSFPLITLMFILMVA